MRETFLSVFPSSLVNFVIFSHFSQHKAQLLQSFAFDQIALIIYSERLSSLIIFCLPYLSQTYDYSVRPWLSLEQNTNEYLIILIIRMYDLLYINKNNFILIFDICEVRYSYNIHKTHLCVLTIYVERDLLICILIPFSVS